MSSFYVLPRLCSKSFLNFIHKTAEYCNSSPFKNLQALQLFSATSKTETKRCIPSTIGLPSYVTSSQLKTPSIAEIKTDEQISQMLPACKLAASILKHVGNNIKVSSILLFQSEIKINMCCRLSFFFKIK